MPRKSRAFRPDFHKVAPRSHTRAVESLRTHLRARGNIQDSQATRLRRMRGGFGEKSLPVATVSYFAWTSGTLARHHTPPDATRRHQTPPHATESARPARKRVGVTSLGLRDLVSRLWKPSVGLVLVSGLQGYCRRAAGVWRRKVSCSDWLRSCLHGNQAKAGARDTRGNCLKGLGIAGEVKVGGTHESRGIPGTNQNPSE